MSTTDPTGGRAAAQGLSTEIPTETAVTAFQLVGGLFGGIAAIIASRRLSALPGETISLASLAIPVLIAGGSTVIGALFLPST